MFILSPDNTQKLVKNLENAKNFDASKIYKQVKKKLNWIKINFGDVLILISICRMDISNKKMKLDGL